MTAVKVLKDYVKADGRGRITQSIPKMKGRSFSVSEDEFGNIIFTPVTVVPDRELWLLDNSEARASVTRGIKQAKAGKIHDLGSFAKYADEDADE